VQCAPNNRNIGYVPLGLDYWSWGSEERIV